MSSTVHLHIGEPKSGTTYLQSVLALNVDTLRGAGWLYPRPADQIRAAQDAIRGKEGGALWRELVSTLEAWDGPNALISMETLCRARRPAVKRALEPLTGMTTRVHLTVRDLLRSLPAQWQQTTQHRKTWGWPEYCSAITQEDADAPVTRNFWSQHDLADMLQVWTSEVGANNVYVITVPPSGSDPSLLWQRFSQALGIEALQVQFGEPANESLGAVSAELLRRLNERLDEFDLTERQYSLAVRQTLSRQILATRRSDEPKVEVPETALPWAERHAERIISAIQATGVNVVGDLSDLRPTSVVTGAATVPTDEQLLDAALAAIAGLVNVVGKR